MERDINEVLRELEQRMDKLQAERDAAMATLRRRREVPETFMMDSGTCFRCMKPVGGIMVDGLGHVEPGAYCASCGAKVLTKSEYRLRHPVRNRPGVLSF